MNDNTRQIIETFNTEPEFNNFMKYQLNAELNSGWIVKAIGLNSWVLLEMKLPPPVYINTHHQKWIRVHRV